MTDIPMAELQASYVPQAMFERTSLGGRSLESEKFGLKRDPHARRIQG